MPYWWGIMRRKQISMAATCTLLVALKNLTECLSLPSSSQHWSWRGLHAVITIVRDLLVCFFFSRPIIFLFSHFREGNVIKKIALTRRNLTVTKRICSIFVKCTLPKKKKKHLPRDYSKTLQVVTFSLYLMVLKKFQHQVQRVHLPRKTY